MKRFSLPVLAAVLVPLFLVPALLTDHPWEHRHFMDAWFRSLPRHSIAELCEADNFITLTAVGDIMPGRNVECRALSLGDPGYSFRRVREHLAGDILFGNLESPLGEGPASSRGTRFRADPRFAAALRGAGFHVLSLANNHALDRGPAGLSETAERLMREGIAVSGPVDAAGGMLTVILKRGNLRVAFVSITDVPPNAVKNVRYPEICAAREAALLEELRRLRKCADLTVLSVHWGDEYANIPTARQRRLGRLFIDGGARLVLGHHPHVVQPVERYRDGLIFYSLGNFIFDQMQSRHTRGGIIVKVRFFRDRVIGYSALPVFMERVGEPVPAEGGEREDLLGKLRAIPE